MDAWLAAAMEWWRGLGYDVHFVVWSTAGLLLFGVLARTAFHALRRLAGQRKFRGNWYNPVQFEALLQMLMEDHRAGQRVMRFDELQLLRREMLGKDFKPLFQREHGGYM